MNLPTVSVCIASYNHARFLPRCLDSILGQTFQNFEIVVVDDGSKDNSHEILLEYQEKNREKVFYHWHLGHVNKGISATTNAAIQLSRGKYIAFIGSDDTWYPEKLEKQVALMEQHAEYGYVYSYADFIDEEDQLQPGLYGVDITHDPNPTGRMIISCHQPAMTVMIRRAALEKITWFDEALIYSDWDLMLRLTACWPAGFINEPLAKYRIHGKNISKRIDPKVDFLRILDFVRAVRRKSAEVGGKLVEPRNQALLTLQQAFLNFCLGDEKSSLDNLQRAFEIDAALLSDIPFLEGWVNEWKLEFSNPSLPNFGFWLIDHLPKEIAEDDRTKWALRYLDLKETQQFFVRRGIERGQSGEPVEGLFADVPASIPLPSSWKEQILKQVYPTLLFHAHQNKEKDKIRSLWLATIRHDPSWLLNRGVISIGLRAFFK